MKTIIVALALLMAASVVGAEEIVVRVPTIGDKLIEMVLTGPEHDVTYFLKDGQLTVKRNPEYIEVVTRNTTYRIYPCGKLEKLTWKELNQNEDKPVITGGLSRWIAVPKIQTPSLNMMTLEAPLYY